MIIQNVIEQARVEEPRNWQHRARSFSRFTSTDTTWPSSLKTISWAEKHGSLYWRIESTLKNLYKVAWRPNAGPSCMLTGVHFDIARYFYRLSMLTAYQYDSTQARRGLAEADNLSSFLYLPYRMKGQREDVCAEQKVSTFSAVNLLLPDI